MKRPLQVVAIVGLALLCGSACAFASHAKTDKKQQAEDAHTLFQHASELGDITAPGTPPYLLRIRFRGVGQLRGYPGGTREVRFASPTEFRLDQTYGDSRFASGAHGDDKKQWHSGDTKPPALVESVFGRGMSDVYGPSYLQFPSGSKPKVTERTVNGLSMNCVEQKTPAYFEACLDATTGALIVQEDSDGFVCQYSEFRSWGSHLVPGEILVFANNAPILEATVETLEALPSDQAEASAFAPPPDAKFPAPSPPHCQVEQARLVNEVRPDYPHSTDSPKNNGLVVLWGFIDETGRVSDLIVIQSAGATFDQAAIEAVKKWQYSPTKICDQPVRNDGTFRVAFPQP